MAEALGRLESEVFAQQSDIVSVDLARLVPGAVSQGELGTLAANQEARYPALAQARQLDCRST